MIVVNGKNHWQLTSSADGKSQDKTEQQRLVDGWPPPDGTSVLKADQSTSTSKDIGKADAV